ncbi:serine hydrolase domain-containing protein [Peribacillus acanthi]|uniref:serine hydrolase domain-containing protein n=1 Tax=Peribacillus acanthi TaxID=2171554 RepID=UPI000D3E7427|nr:serine hydrolase domain-containing protein [Peribacillus acanthi]
MSVLIKNIQQIMEDSMKANNIPGAAVAVIKNHEIILSEGFGRTNVEDWGVPVNSDTLFRIASVSKLFTGTIMMMLVEKGLIDLDKPVQYYVPWFTAADQELSKLITIRMLLSHSSGLPTGGELSFRYKESGLYHYMKDVVPTLSILFHPGTAYSYGNHALNIAGFVAEQVTNKSFESLMQEMLFDPLEMNQTTYNPLIAMTYPLALPHNRDVNGNLSISHRFFDNSASYPSYYAFSSIQDLSQFALMHLQDGVYQKKRLISSDSVHEMRSQQSKWHTLTNGGCGITFFKETKDDIDRYWHYGQYSYHYSSQFILVPEKGIAVIALANGENIFQAGYEIIDELLKEESKGENTSIQPNATELINWDHFTGTYLHSYYGLFDISYVTGKAILKYNERQFELSPYNQDTYLAKDDDGNTVFTVGFRTPTEEQSIKSIMVNSNACPEYKTAYTPNVNDWIHWQGTYSDGDDTYEVLVQGETLMIKDIQNRKEMVTSALESNKFLTKEYGLVSFIEINQHTILEFGNAWRFPKQNASVLSY